MGIDAKGIFEHFYNESAQTVIVHSDWQGSNASSFEVKALKNHKRNPRRDVFQFAERANIGRDSVIQIKGARDVWRVVDTEDRIINDEFVFFEAYVEKVVAPRGRSHDAEILPTEHATFNASVHGAVQIGGQGNVQHVSVHNPSSHAAVPFDEVYLEAEQKELLTALIEAHRRVPRSERRDFVFHIASVHKGAHSRVKMHEFIDQGNSIAYEGRVITKKEDIPRQLDQDFITHSGLDTGSIDTHLSDVDALKLQNLINFRDETRFFITPQGFACYEKTKMPQPRIQEPFMAVSQSTTEFQTSATVPRAFISYSWDSDEHRDWVREVASRLRSDGVDVTLDQWHAAPGDQLPAFMERAVRENDYVLIVCTLRYKEKSDGRQGGVGYEGDIMTSEAFVNRNHRKFIPILRHETWDKVAPSWLAGKYYIDLRGAPYQEEKYGDLLVTLHGQREQAPPVGVAPSKKFLQGRSAPVQLLPPEATPDPIAPIVISGIVADEITVPRNDGTRGSGLYAIPFRLSRRPSSQWSQLLVEIWNRPPQFSTMHRPGIARVEGDKLILDGTTVEEVEKHHRDTLKLVIERTNQLAAEYEQKKQRIAEQERQRIESHKQSVRDAANRLNFD